MQTLQLSRPRAGKAKSAPTDLITRVASLLEGAQKRQIRYRATTTSTAKPQKILAKTVHHRVATQSERQLAAHRLGSAVARGRRGEWVLMRHQQLPKRSVLHVGGLTARRICSMFT
jgi:hypothetical protein